MNHNMRIPKLVPLGAFCALQLLNSTQAAVDLGVVQTSTIGHAFIDPNIGPPPDNEPRSVVDYLIDQDQSSGGGGALPSLSVNWDTNTQFTLTVSAPPGQKYSVHVPAGRAVGFGGFLWWESTRGGFSPPGSVEVSFDGLEGTPPAFSSSDSVLSDSHGFFGFMDLEGTLVTNDFAFTSIRMTGTVAPQFTGNGTEDYIPHHESAMQLFYQTTETNDPGRFVFLVPAATNALPVVNWIRPTNGQAFAARSSILLRATASDPDGYLTNLDFVVGTNVVRRFSGFVTNGTYNVSWSNAQAGTYQLHAEALDNTGAQGASVPVQIVLTNPPPSNSLPIVNLIRPTNGAVYTAGTSLFLAATASDADGTISYVEFFAGSLNLGRAVWMPDSGFYTLMWSNPPAGMYQLRAEAVDNAGGRGVSASAQVAVSGLTNVPPTLDPLIDLTILEDAGNQTAALSGISSGSPNEFQVLTITAVSSNPGLIPAPVINYISPATTGSLIFKPATNAFGTATITVVVNDGQSSQNVVAQSFIVTVVPVNDMPRISAIPDQSINKNTSTGPIAFTVQDAETPASSLMVNGSSSNPGLVPAANLLFGGSGATRTLTVIPAVDQFGTATITLTVQDSDGGIGSRSFFLTVNNTSGTNAPPTNMVPVVNLTRPTNGAVFALGAPILLTASASDSDGTLSLIDFLAGTNLLQRLSGTLTNGFYNFMWSNAPVGTLQLRAEAVDNAGARSASASVQITVSGTNGPVNTPPVISAIPNQSINKNTLIGPIPFTVRDVETPASSLIVNGTSSNPSLIPAANLALGGSGTNRTVTVIPALDQVGTAIITLTVRDTDGGAASRSFSVTVNNTGGTNAPPTNNALPVVNWIRPTNGSVLAPGTPVLLTVSATDADGTISYVDFFVGSTWLSRGAKVPTNSTYNLVWTNPPSGVFRLHAEAVDNAGGRGTSAPVEVVVGEGAMVDLGVVEASTIGHAFIDPNIGPPGFPEIMPRAVVDYLVDQDQSSGGGGLLPAASINWDTNNQFKLTVAAPRGMKFVVDVPAGGAVGFGGFLWWESTRGGFSGSGEVAASFTDLEGAAPVFDESDSVLSDSHGFFGFMDLEGTTVTNRFAFTSITLTGTVIPQYTGNGTENFLPHHESSMQLYYSTTETNDPGSFVSIMPIGPLPAIRVIAASPVAGVDLMVYGEAGRTHIVECSTDTVTWTAISSGVIPRGGSLRIKDASAAAVDSRFYRVVEVP